MKVEVPSSEFSVLMETVPVGVFVAYDVACTKMSANSIARAMLRLPAESNASQSAPQDEKPPFRTYRDGVPLSPEELPMQRAVATGMPVWNQEETVRFDDGTEINLLVNAKPLFDSEGKVRGGIATALDITQQKRTTQELEVARETLRARAADLEKNVEDRTAELKSTIGDLESFSYTVSHDLRAPLRAIQGYAQSVVDDFGDSLPEEGLRRLQRIDRAAQRLDRLVQEVLLYSRIGKGRVDLAPIALNDLISGLFETYPDIRAQLDCIEIKQPLLSVVGNESLLSQCLANLLGNAFKFVPKGMTPHVVISTQSVDDGNVRISVADNGIGIDPSHHTRIFEIFGRVYADEHYPGTGIGLAIVKKAVERMRGTIGLDSSLGEGSIFWMELNGITHE